MKICYIANIRMPTEKGHGLQIMKMCEAFALLDHEVRLIVPGRDNFIKEDPFDFYKIDHEARKKIKITYVKSFDPLKGGKLGYWFQYWTFAEMAAIEMRKDWPDVVYSRDFVILFNMMLIHPNLVWEAHQGEDSWMIRVLLKKAKLVAITYGLVELYSRYLKSIDDALVAPDAVDLREFDIQLTREQCRDKLCLPKTQKIALYWGHLYAWKGVQTLADAAHLFNNYELAVVVGGTDYDIDTFKKANKGNPHLLIVGKRPRNEIGMFMKAADVLVLPNTKKEKISSHYTSPLKLFENMASGTPIVASDLPSLREVLDECNCVFFMPDDPKSLFEAVREVFSNPELAREISAKAYEDVQHYTWDKRAQKIIEYMS